VRSLTVRRPPRAGRRDDGGFSLVELIVAMSILMLVLALVVSIVAVLSATTYRSLNVSTQTNTAQVSTTRFEQFMTGIVPPMVAATSSFPSSTATSAAISSATPCWGTSQPASTTLPSTSSTIPSTGQSLTAPSRVSVTVAHDFDMVWCGYAPNTSTPSVYEANLQGCSGTFGNCTLTIENYGTGCVPGTGSPGANGSSSGCTSGTVVLTIPHVWCDTYCQGATSSAKNPSGATVSVACLNVPGNTTAKCANATPPLFSYFNSGNGRYNTTVNSVTVTDNSATVSVSSGGFNGITAGMTINGTGIPSGTTVSSVSGNSLTMSGNATATSSESLAFVGTNFQNSLNYVVANETAPSACTGFSLFLDLAQNSAASCSDPVSYLPGIQDVTLNLTILSNGGTPGGGNSTSQASTSSATVDNQILLSNQLQANSSCGASTFEYPPDLTSYFPLDDSQNPMADLGQTSNGTSQTDIQMQYNTNTNAAASMTLANGGPSNPNSSSTGPLACNANTAVGTAFNGSTEYGVDDYWDNVTTPSNCSTSLPCLWGPSSATGMTIEGWVEVPTGTVQSTRERILSDGDTSAQGIELALKPASATCGESVVNGSPTNTNGYQPGGIVFSADGGSWYTCLASGLAAGTWYFVAATVTWASTVSATVYIDASSSGTTVGTAPTTSGQPSNSPGCPVVIGAEANSAATPVTTACSSTGTPGNFFDGDIADVATYSTALTATQLLTQYNELSQ